MGGLIMTDLLLYTSDGHAIPAKSEDIQRVIHDVEEKHDFTPRNFSLTFDITSPFDKVAALIDFFANPTYEVYERRLPRKQKKRMKKIMFKELGFIPKFRFVFKYYEKRL